MLDTEDCWRAVLERDKGRDGSFVFGVTTTGVYCRPSCPARRPLPQNVRFYETTAQAETEGLRPCRRCRPTAPRDESMIELCAYIRRNCASGDALTLDRLAGQAGLSPAHLQRKFRAAIGVSPRKYVEACRLEGLKGRLRASGTVTDAIYESGFGSASRVYERADSRLGMTPGEYRAGARHSSIAWAIMRTPPGLLMVAATDRGVCFVAFGESDDELVARLRAEYPAAELRPMPQPYPDEFRAWTEALARHLESDLPQLDIPLDIRATAFQFRVWNYLQSIPSGEVRTYAEVAAGIGQPTAARAVARACASNRVALVIPCHRVIRGDGADSGYRWGAERKRALLDRERGSDRA